MKFLILLPFLVSAFVATVQAEVPEFESKQPQGLIAIPAVVEFIKASPSKIPERIEEILKASGPKELQGLIDHFHQKETIDRDGRYLSIPFFYWFADEDKNTPELRARQRQVAEEWEKALPDSPEAKLAVARFWIGSAWDARGKDWASKVSNEQWGGFRERLAIARTKLMACKELQDNDPAWTDCAFRLLMGEGGKRDEFEEVATRYFEKFPECEVGGSQAMLYLAPRWGGKKGEWEPWLREKLKSLPEDVRARAYTRTIIAGGGMSHSSYGRRKEMIEPVRFDFNLLNQGIKSLYEKYPDSPWVANGEALIAAHLRWDVNLTIAAFRRAKGRIDMRVWYPDGMYESVMKWIFSTKKPK